MLTTWTIVSILALVGAVIAIKYTDRYRHVLIGAGLFVMFVDLLVETYGTATGAWGYNESIFFIDLYGGHVPIELPMMFFGAGVIAAAILYNTRKYENAIRWEATDILLIWAGVGFALYLLGIADLLLMFLVPLGLWGLIHTKIPKLALAIAFGALIVDAILELYFTVWTSTYWYQHGFNYLIPLCYFFGALAVIGIIGPRKRNTTSIIDNIGGE